MKPTSALAWLATALITLAAGPLQAQNLSHPTPLTFHVPVKLTNMAGPLGVWCEVRDGNNQPLTAGVRNVQGGPNVDQTVSVQLEITDQFRALVRTWRCVLGPELAPNMGGAAAGVGKALAIPNNITLLAEVSCRF
jgi:hypothetical protein